VDSGLSAGAILVVFRVEKELLCKAQACGGGVVLHGYIFCILIIGSFWAFVRKEVLSVRYKLVLGKYKIELQ